MEESSITGGCYCGRVRFRANGPTLYQANCHCANCRRAAGAQAVAWITVKLSEFAFEKGEPTRYRTDTGASRTFCDSCGTSLTYENDERPNEIDITTGSRRSGPFSAEPRCLPGGEAFLGGASRRRRPALSKCPRSIGNPIRACCRAPFRFSFANVRLETACS